MDELAEELSGTTLDEEPRQDSSGQKAKISKPVNRTASIINRSKLLILSDSESEEEECQENLKNMSKHMRVSKPRTINSMRKGKRKRNSASESYTAPGTSFASLGIRPRKGNRVKLDRSESMEVEPTHHQHPSDSSDIESEDCLTDCNCDGDDEQSDFPDSASYRKPPSRSRTRSHRYAKTEFKIPTKPVNPFSIDFDAHLSPSSSLWKKRRPLH